LVHQRTELVNALRSTLYEYGHTVPQGIGHLRRIKAFPEEPHSDLPMLVHEACRDLLAQIAETTVHIDARTVRIKALATETDSARRLQTMPGIGPVTALAVEAFAPEMTQFRRGRDFAAWLGLVPRQRSSGGKVRLGRVSKAGQADIRRLLIIGAMARLTAHARRSIPQGSWLARMLEKKPRMLVAIALANEMARTIWAMLTKEEGYWDPPAQAAAA
jgi:transposase